MLDSDETTYGEFSCELMIAPYCVAVTGSRESGSRPVLLFVLGFGRSGTSALARVLSLCGATLPAGLLGATSDNPRGCFEPRAAIHLNESILRSHGSSGYDPTLRMQEEGVFDERERATWIAKIRAYLASLPDAPLVVIKEPKITMLTDLWFEAAGLAGFDVAAIIAIRHPDEVVGSLERRSSQQRYVRNSAALTSAWWLKFTLLAERNTRGIPRVFLDYTNLLEDWRREMKRAAVALSVDLDARDEPVIDEFLTSDLHHHRRIGPVPEPFGTDWLSSVYESMSAAACDEPWDPTKLDHVFEQYRSAERGFRMVFEDHGRYRNINRAMPPFLIKLVLGGLALLHRRRGTWT